MQSQNSQLARINVMDGMTSKKKNLSQLVENNK